MTKTIDKKVGIWFRATVLDVTKDRIKLYNEDINKEVWVDKKKLRIMPRTYMAYITLPGYSTHEGRRCKEFCLER